jgi:hypothetical protein
MMIAIRWKDKAYSPYVDVLTQDTFKQGQIIEHPTVCKGNKPFDKHLSRARVRKVEAGFVELDYGGELAAYNEEVGCDTGVMRVPLTGASGNTVWWRDADKTKLRAEGTAVFI